MSIEPDKLAKIRNDTCEGADKVIERIKKKYGFDNLSIGGQKALISQIQEGLMDAADCHKPDEKPESPE